MIVSHFIPCFYLSITLTAKYTPNSLPRQRDTDTLWHDYLEVFYSMDHRLFLATDHFVSSQRTILSRWSVK